MRCGPFRWPWQCDGAILRASPDEGGPGLSLKTVIGRLLTPYCPGNRQGDNQQNNDDTIQCTTFADHFDGRGGAPVLYRTHRPMEEVHGFLKSH